ncbi:ABC transporter ATP-binding protein [Geotoga petraea]|uniref:Lipoprotein-releasing system ATP-binding protein n=1 Tax=Geotoga petraea TaxID=28234 RepID=A0A1G6JKI2_9BACT|nr:ATP-binding cassette domain-containing protein [Geotoga petraea]MDK2945389.1 hypothetical protein [Geotoga sp.]SDC19171.1 lipoprotein-releasing system ATP-binding protein [Geotoga petraea]
MENNIIEATDLSFSYDHQKVLKNINIQIEKNKIFSIYGPSGSGKTTLLFILAELIKNYSGKLSINHNFKKGFLFQKNNLLNELTIYDNLRISQLIKGIDNESEIINIMKKLNVYRLKDRLPNELSTGEQQRIAFIKNIISNDLIFFDEPTSSLDSKNAEELIDILKKYSNNKTYVIATHDERIKLISDKIFYLEDGVIL